MLMVYGVGMEMICEIFALNRGKLFLHTNEISPIFLVTYNELQYRRQNASRL